MSINIKNLSILTNCLITELVGRASKVDEATGSIPAYPFFLHFSFSLTFCVFAFCRGLHGAMPPWRCVRHRTTCLQLSGTTFRRAYCARSENVLTLVAVVKQTPVWHNFCAGRDRLGNGAGFYMIFESREPTRVVRRRNDLFNHGLAQISHVVG